MVDFPDPEDPQIATTDERIKKVALEDSKFVYKISMVGCNMGYKKNNNNKKEEVMKSIVIENQSYLSVDFFYGKRKKEKEKRIENQN